MNITEFAKMLEEGAILAEKAKHANLYLSEEETNAAFNNLEAFF